MPLGAADRDVGEPARLALAQPLQLVEVARIRRRGRPAGGAPPRGRRAPRAGARARSASAAWRRARARGRASRVKHATAASASEAVSARRPARSQNAAAPAGSPPRSRCSAITAGGSSRPAKNRDASSRPIARVRVALRARRQRVVDDLADEAARELQVILGSADRRRRAHEEARLDSSSSSSPSVSSSSSSSSRRARNVPPSTAANRSARLAFGAQAIDARGDHVARRRGHVVAGLAHGLRELLDEQRVAAAAREHRGDVERRRRIAEAVGDQRAQLAADQVADVDHDVDRGRRRALRARGQHEQLGAASRGRASAWRSTSRLALSARWMSSMIVSSGRCAIGHRRAERGEARPRSAAAGRRPRARRRRRRRAAPSRDRDRSRPRARARPGRLPCVIRWSRRWTTCCRAPRVRAPAAGRARPGTDRSRARTARGGSPGSPRSSTTRIGGPVARAPRDQLGDEPALAGAGGAADQGDEPAVRGDRALEPRLELGELRACDRRTLPRRSSARAVALVEAARPDDLDAPCSRARAAARRRPRAAS